MSRFRSWPRLGLVFLFASPLAAQTPVRTDSTGKAFRVAPIVVTATREPLALPRVPAAVDLIDSAALRERPVSSPVELFAGLAGLDLTGVGPNQVRPVIRGERGQRILLLEDGLRLNNTRRQQDFGELSSLVDQDALDRVEVVRGPSSVLYGSDAIGGVVNLIGAGLPWGTAGSVLHGAARYSYATNGGETRPSATLYGREGRVAFRVDGATRTADPYRAPAGSFGNATLADATKVNDSGIRDHNLSGRLGVALSDRQRLWVKGWTYSADDAGFGWVDPAALGGDQTKVQILYPRQRVTRGTIGYSARSLGSPLADRLDVTGYTQSNTRDLAQNIFVPFGPGAGMTIDTRNYTDVGTVGGRLEAAKLLGTRTLLTYGAEFFRDRTVNTDHDTTTITGFGPPMVQSDSAPNLPNASYRALGTFAQASVQATERLNLVVGARYQADHAETRATPGLPDAPVTSTDHAVVGAFNALYELTPTLTLIGSVGRGFRSPNLVERFFDGVTPEGSGYQSRNPGLKPEASLNTELGLRVRHGALALETFVFRRALTDGIAIEATGDTVSGFPEYRNVNVDRLTTWGAEAQAQALVARVFTLSGSFSWLDMQNSDQPQTPVGESYGIKATAQARYDHPAGHVWSAVRVRHQGKTDQLALGASAIGTTFPGFTVVGVDAGVRLFDESSIRHTLTVSVENAGDALYAEAGNSGFFRPAPGRRVWFAWSAEF